MRTRPHSHSLNDGQHSGPEQYFAEIHNTPYFISNATRVIKTSVAFSSITFPCLESLKEFTRKSFQLTGLLTKVLKVTFTRPNYIIYQT